MKCCSMQLGIEVLPGALASLLLLCKAEPGLATRLIDLQITILQKIAITLQRGNASMTETFS